MILGGSAMKNNQFLTSLNTSAVSASAAIKILENQKKDVREVNFIAPKLGSNSFGKFSVKWKSTKHCPKIG